MKHPLTSSPAPAKEVRCYRWLAAGLLLQAPSVAHASFLHGETLDAMATGLAWFILFAVPILGIVLFWLVHIMPEKIAEKRHHPQKDAINTLCLLSLVFGGLLWPIAWLWAYTKPIGYRLAYGTEKHDDYYVDMTDKAKGGQLLQHELDHLREELDAMAAKGSLPVKLSVLRAELTALQASAAASEAKAEET